MILLDFAINFAIFTTQLQSDGWMDGWPCGRTDQWIDETMDGQCFLYTDTIHASENVDFPTVFAFFSRVHATL